MHLPKINGLTCLARIKELKHLCNVPVLVYSASYDNRSRKRALAMGAASCIRKPTKSSVLMYVLNKLMFKDKKNEDIHALLNTVEHRN